MIGLKKAKFMLLGFYIWIISVPWSTAILKFIKHDIKPNRQCVVK